MQPLPEQVPDTWSTKALPFLRSAVIRFETYGRATGDEIAADTGLSSRELVDTAFRLRDAGFLEFYFEGGGHFEVQAVPERGLRTVGAWPSPESLADRLLDSLREQAESGSSEEQRSRARKVLDAVTAAGRDALVNAAGSALGSGVV